MSRSVAAPPSVAGAAAPPASPAAPTGLPARASVLGRVTIGDAPVLAALGALLVLLVAVTWRKWGVPEIDAGAELTTADRVAHGALPYGDIRYYYGPLGLYGLAAAFKIFGTSFATAYAFGLAQTVAILAATYALARRWVAPAYAGAATAVTMAIGFSGTAFNFVLPHTNSATMGLLFVLLALLALTYDRLVLAGAAVGLVGLTRPEFAAAAWAGLAAYVVVAWRLEGRRAALRSAAALAIPAAAVPLLVLGAFAASVGTSQLLWENLWPRDFIRVAGLRTQSGWMPFSLASGIALVARAAVYGGLLVAFVRSVELVRARRGLDRVRGLWPLAAALVAIVVLDGGARVAGLLPAERTAIEDELKHLTISMSWLPALALGTLAWSARELWHRRGAAAHGPLGGRWAADAALVVVAAALGVRAYNAFTTEGSYAPYYAAPIVVLAAVLHQRLAGRRPGAGAAPLVALVLAAAGLAAYAVAGLYADDSVAVHTPRGTFVTTPRAAGAVAAAVRAVDEQTPAGAPILAAPADGGLYFMTGRRPALYEVMLLPGLLDSAADQRAAIARLQRERVPMAVVGIRDFSAWGWPRFGVDYNAILGTWLRDHTARRTVVGSTADAAAGTYPSAGFELRALRFRG